MATLQIEREAQTLRAPRLDGFRSRNRAVDISDHSIDCLLDEAGMSHARRAWPELARRAETERWGARELLAAVLQAESGGAVERKGFTRRGWLSFAAAR